MGFFRRTWPDSKLRGIYSTDSRPRGICAKRRRNLFCLLPTLTQPPPLVAEVDKVKCSSFEARKSAQLRTEDGDAFERRLWRHLGSSRRSSCPTRASSGPRTERGRGGATHLEQNAIPARTRSCRPPSAHSPPRRGQEGGGRRPTDGVLLFGIFLDVFFREGQEV